MAVYTDVGDADLEAFLQGLRSRRAALLQGHRRGRRELQFPAPHRGRQLHPDALREARRGGRPALLPRPDGASRRSAASRCPLPVRARDGKALRRVAGRPAAIVSFLEGSGCAGRRRIHCAALGRALAEMHQAGARFPARAAPMRSRSTAGATLVEMSRARADTVEPGLAAFIAGGARVPASRAGRRICRRASSMPTSFPTTSSS